MTDSVENLPTASTETKVDDEIKVFLHKSWVKGVVRWAQILSDDDVQW